ncbi:MAG: dihydroorotate dehydrogenase [Candidatus Latescibacterota bacterium]|nr:MAG: dihydroorotate dehydrogenase [Candidatus Latescibacterota bacterium]
MNTAPLENVPLDLSIEIGSLHLKNPVLAASGTFGYGREFAKVMDLSRLGGIVTKAITLEPRLGNPTPRIVETASGMLNSIGLANVGVAAFARDKMPFLRSCGTAVIVNVAGRSMDEYVEVVRRLSDCPGIHALEINISCPNVQEGGLAFGADPKVAAAVIGAVRSVTRLPVIAKLTPNVTDIVRIAEAVQEAGADAVSLINTLVGMAIDVVRRRPELGSVTGGLSGPAIKPVALAMVWKAAQAVRIPVIGMGGIMNAGDALEFMLAGAVAVQVGTANFVDPTSTIRIVEGLEDTLRERGMGSVKEIIGALEV